VSQNTNKAPGAPGGNPPLPYWDEYLATILRPRVERIAQGLASKVEKSAMDALARRIAEEQPNFPGGPDAIEQVLRDTLGLRFQVTLEPIFGDHRGEAAVNDGEGFLGEDVNLAADDEIIDPAVGDVIDGHDSVIQRRPFDNPLARAVGIRKDRGR
jgi:hypothetical protein